MKTISFGENTKRSSMEDENLDDCLYLLSTLNIDDEEDINEDLQELINDFEIFYPRSSLDTTAQLEQ